MEFHHQHSSRHRDGWHHQYFSFSARLDFSASLLLLPVPWLPPQDDSVFCLKLRYNLDDCQYLTAINFLSFDRSASYTYLPILGMAGTALACADGMMIPRKIPAFLFSRFCLAILVAVVLPLTIKSMASLPSIRSWLSNGIPQQSCSCLVVDTLHKMKPAHGKLFHWFLTQHNRALFLRLSSSFSFASDHQPTNLNYKPTSSTPQKPPSLDNMDGHYFAE